MSKKTLFSLALISNVMLLTAQVQQTVAVQSTKSWTWTNYQVAFQAPTDLSVKENSDKVFYAGNGHVFLNIYPKTADTINQNNLPQAVQRWASDHKLSYSSNASSSSLSTAGYVTNSSRYPIYFLAGNGYKGMQTYAAIIIDTNNPGRSYYVWLQYQNGYSTTAMNILNSFSAQ